MWPMLRPMPMTKRLLACVLLATATGCTSSTPSATTTKATATSSPPSPGVFLKNDEQAAVTLAGCTRCTTSGLRIAPGEEVAVDLLENQNVLTVTAAGQATCFTVFFGVQPASAEHLLVSHAGKC
jgi:hypothetical protein